MREHNGLLEDVAAVIGFSATTRLVAFFGEETGKNLLIPVEPHPEHAITRAVGLPAMRLLVAEWGGQVLRLYSHADFHHARLVRSVSAMIKDGMPPKDIAATIGIDERHVRRLRREAEENGLLPLVLGVGGKRVGVVVDTVA